MEVYNNRLRAHFIGLDKISCMVYNVYTMKFKKGDKVMVSKDEHHVRHYHGMVGVVKGESGSKFYRHAVQFSDGIGIFASFELEKVE